MKLGPGTSLGDDVIGGLEILGTLAIDCTGIVMDSHAGHGFIHARGL